MTPPLFQDADCGTVNILANEESKRETVSQGDQTGEIQLDCCSTQTRSTATAEVSACVGVRVSPRYTLPKARNIFWSLYGYIIHRIAVMLVAHIKQRAVGQDLKNSKRTCCYREVPTYRDVAFGDGTGDPAGQ